jgi:hypothetical protein
MVAENRLAETVRLRVVDAVPLLSLPVLGALQGSAEAIALGLALGNLSSYAIWWLGLRRAKMSERDIGRPSDEQPPSPSDLQVN